MNLFGKPHNQTQNIGLFSKIKNKFRSATQTQKQRTQMNNNFIRYPIGHDLYNNINHSNASSYKTNVVVYRCVHLIAQAISHIPFNVCTKNDMSNLVTKLLNRPNSEQSGFAFFNALISQKLLFGNVYVVAYINRHIRALHLLHPESVEVVVDDENIIGYLHNKKHMYHNRDSKSSVLHIKNYDPSDQIYGMSPLESAKLSIEQHTKSTQWNNSLLKNGARPTGAILIKNDYLSDEQFVKLKAQLDEVYSGPQNTGKPLLLEGGLEWVEMGISPRDMDFLESKNNAAREIALAFGVPPQLLGIKGDNTYNNMQEARIGLWEETIIPMMDELCDILSIWLSGITKSEICISFDKNNISILSEKRQKLWESLAAADFMTLDEKRSIAGLPKAQ